MSEIILEVSAGTVVKAPADTTLTISGMAADAKAAGDLIRQQTADTEALRQIVVSTFQSLRSILAGNTEAAAALDQAILDLAVLG